MGYLGTKPSNSPLTSELIPDGLIATSDIADNAITTAKIAAGAVVQADLATGVAGTGPAFSAYSNSPQSISTGTLTKILFQVEEYDTNNNFDSSRFTPTVAGYYFIQGSMQAAVSWTGGYVSIYKNGSEYKISNMINQGAGDTGTFNSSCLVYCNGSTDYIEIYGLFGIGQNVNNNIAATWFQGYLVRAA